MLSNININKLMNVNCSLSYMQKKANENYAYIVALFIQTQPGFFDIYFT